MVNTKINLSMTEPYVRQIYAKQGDTGRVLEIGLEDATLENGTLRILRPDGLEKTSDAVSSDSPTITDGMASFESLDEAEVTSLKVGISPVQDLHGYANPWVGGAGVNIIGDFGLETTKTGSGVTATRQEDGSTYALSGTATADVDIYILPNSNNRATDVGNYVVYAPTGTGLFGTSNYLIVSVYNESTSATRYIGVGGSANYNTFSIASGEHIRAIYIKVANGTNTNGKIVTPMIVKGSTAPTSYAPYSNICPIYAGNGKNLLPNTYERLSHNGVVGTVNADGTVSLSGTATSTAYLRGDYFTLKAGTYTITGCPYGGASSTYRAYLEDVAGSTDNGQSPTFTVASDVSTRYIIQVANGVDSSNLLFKPQLERGSLPSLYVPYQGINIEERGKNLLYVAPFADRTESGITYNAENDGSVNISGTAQSLLVKRVGAERFIKGKTYTISGGISSNVSLTLRNVTGGTLPPELLSGSTSDTGNGATFTALVDFTGYLNFRVPSGYAISGKVTMYPQIELGSTATSYVPYQGNTYLISLGQPVYGGTLDVVGGKLYISKVLKTVTQSDSFAFLSSTGYYQFTYYPDNTIYASGGSVSSICSCMPKIALSDRGRISGLASYDGDTGYRFALNSDMGITTVDDFKNFAIANNLSFTMERITPIEVDLTPTQITTLLGTNNMWADGEISELTFDYGKLLSVLTADQTEVVGRCLGDVNFGGASTMPFTLVVKPNNKENA